MRRKLAILLAAAFRIRARPSINGAPCSRSTTTMASPARSGRFSERIEAMIRATKRRSVSPQPAGDLLRAIRERAGTLSQAQQQVAAAVLEEPQCALRASVDALARRANVSPPSIIR